MPPLPKRALGRRDELGYKGNLATTRHGWLRLTPAYSVALVGEILDEERPRGRVLDPFCGTGTTALACAERGLACDTTDINPFLLWLGRAKTRRYGDEDLAQFAAIADGVGRALVDESDRRALWTPPLHRIERWWPPRVLASLARGWRAIEDAQAGFAVAACDLARLAFCRTLIAAASVSFGHQSMSFARASSDSVDQAASAWRDATALLAATAPSPIHETPRFLHCDARDLDGRATGPYACVLTSPPYPNRMSYVRELRPYMYWLRFLDDRRGAGELDWQAIGGTWGAATSRLASWSPPSESALPWRGFDALVARIARSSDVLARYVHKYFVDLRRHLASVGRVVAAGGRVHYVVGNSKFYDELVPVERILGALLVEAGFRDVAVRTLRKRSSKKELFEYVVSATRA